MQKQTHYWEEPVKEGSKWYAKKFDMSGKGIGQQEFNSENEAWKFLKHINVYVVNPKTFELEKV